MEALQFAQSLWWVRISRATDQAGATNQANQGQRDQDPHRIHVLPPTLQQHAGPVLPNSSCFEFFALGLDTREQISPGFPK